MSLPIPRSFRSIFVPVLSLACAIAMAGASPARVKADSTLYTLTDLGSLGCCNDGGIWESSALGLNNVGDIVGVTTSPTDPSVTLPFIYREGQMTAITSWAGEARGINDAGQATGSAVRPGRLLPHAFVYQRGVFIDLGTLPGSPNNRYSTGNAINRNGTVVGESNNSAAIYRNGAWDRLRKFSARIAYDVNDAGDVVGLLESRSGGRPHDDHGFLFSDHRLIDIGTLDGQPGSVTVPVGINNRRQIAGYGWIENGLMQRAFLWENGAFQDLGTLRGGYAGAMGLNNRGDVVGFSDASVFVYRDGVMIDLNQVVQRNESIWPVIQDVHAINNRGQIVGNAYIEDADGVVHLRACLLTPIAGSF